MLAHQLPPVHLFNAKAIVLGRTEVSTLESRMARISKMFSSSATVPSLQMSTENLRTSAAKPVLKH